MLTRNAWLGLVLVVVFLPSMAFGQEMMLGKWWHDKALTGELRLTDSERSLLDEKYTESRRRLIDLKAEVERERFELDTLLDAPDLNKEQVMGHYENLEKARAKLSKERFGLLLEVREIIGAKRFRELKDRHRSKDGKRIKRYRDDDRSDRERD